MRAKKVNEFQRNKDITKSLGIGEDRPFQPGDKIRLKYHIEKNRNRWKVINYYSGQMPIGVYTFVAGNPGYPEHFHDGEFNYITNMERKYDDWEQIIINHPEWWERINEVNEFQRGNDITKSLDIGDNRNFNEGDKILLKETIYYDEQLIMSDDKWFTEEELENIKEYDESEYFRKRQYLNNPWLYTHDVLELDEKGDWCGPWTHASRNIVSSRWINKHLNIIERISSTQNESMDFTRDDNIQKSLGVGEHRPFEIGDEVIALENIYYNRDINDEIDVDQSHNQWFTQTDYVNAYNSGNHEVHEALAKNLENVWAKKGDKLIYQKATDDYSEDFVFGNKTTSNNGATKIIAGSWASNHMDSFERVYKVNEDFNRDKNITKSLGIGEHRKFKDGDKIKLKTYLANNGNAWYEVSKESRNYNKVKGEILKYHDEIGIFSFHNDDWIRIEQILDNPDWWERIEDVNEFHRAKSITKSLDIGTERKELELYNILTHIRQVIQGYDGLGDLLKKYKGPYEFEQKKIMYFHEILGTSAENPVFGQASGHMIDILNTIHSWHDGYMDSEDVLLDIDIIAESILREFWPNERHSPFWHGEKKYENS